ncbi:hypothetical protein AKJ09_08920 [Labilithrix luteola]|uniref:Uncharacterized protein n=1 Tax=Labilithrix luteola TaxID=1391654 RepID=A0A0K1Q9C5_9BACT|nr:hypothetical protein AKJ09_08920 [Labilithrix luteola]
MLLLRGRRCPTLLFGGAAAVMGPDAGAPARGQASKEKGQNQKPLTHISR